MGILFAVTFLAVLAVVVVLVLTILKTAEQKNAPVISRPGNYASPGGARRVIIRSSSDGIGYRFISDDPRARGEIGGTLTTRPGWFMAWDTQDRLWVFDPDTQTVRLYYVNDMPAGAWVETRSPTTDNDWDGAPPDFLSQLPETLRKKQAADTWPNMGNAGLAKNIFENENANENENKPDDPATRPASRPTTPPGGGGRPAVAATQPTGWVWDPTALSTGYRVGPGTQPVVVLVPERTGSVEIYLVAEWPDDAPITRLSEVELGAFVLADEPLIDEDDIVEYDWETHTIHLVNQAVADRILKRRGVGDEDTFMVVANGQRLYAGVMTSILASLVPDTPVIHVGATPDPNQYQPAASIRIHPPVGLGKPDPRNDKRLWDALNTLGLLRNGEPTTEPAE